jgi:sterol desaturase/sphingolipid hydroxylase (fatty acid hydroxylase superfamily)
MPIEQTIRLSVFTGVLLLVALWEIAAPRRPLQDSKPKRWFANLGMIVIDTVTVRLLFPVFPIALAQLAETRGWGIFNIVSLAPWLAFVLSFLLLDLIIYLQHVMFHHLPILWRLHRMHHTDLDLDVTSGNRFHPLEIVISMVIKLAAVMLLGPSPLVVLAFEVILNASAMFNHGNIKLPEALDRLLRLLVVTPDMHRVHHSVVVRETNSNFGFNFPWWDRICGTYRAQPENGHLYMTIGLKEYRDPGKLTLLRLLLQPFTS